MQQGDPLGPLFFALAWQDVILHMPQELALNLWYLDDGHLVGSADAISQALATLENLGLEIGVCLNRSKCRVWGPASAALDLTPFPGITIVPWQPESGIEVLGLPVDFPSSLAFSRRKLNKIVSSLEDACHLLSSLGEPHHQHLLLRHCLDACRLTFFLRGHGARHLDELLDRAAGCIRRCLEDIAAADHLTPTVGAKLHPLEAWWARH